MIFTIDNECQNFIWSHQSTNDCLKNVWQLPDVHLVIDRLADPAAWGPTACWPTTCQPTACRLTASRQPDEYLVLKDTHTKKHHNWKNTHVAIKRINIFPFSSGSKCMGNCDKIHVAKYTDWIMSLGKFKRGKGYTFLILQCNVVVVQLEDKLNFLFFPFFG